MYRDYLFIYCCVKTEDPVEAVGGFLLLLLLQVCCSSLATYLKSMVILSVGGLFATSITHIRFNYV